MMATISLGLITMVSHDCTPLSPPSPGSAGLVGQDSGGAGGGGEGGLGAPGDHRLNPHLLNSKYEVYCLNIILQYHTLIPTRVLVTPIPPTGIQL